MSNECEECVGRSFGLRQLAYRALVGKPGVEEWKTFDIGVAMRIVNNGRAPMEYPSEYLQQFVENNQYTEAHVEHVDATQPGILAFVPMPDGNTYAAIIDGSHRAVKCYREGKPFRVLALTEKETVEVMEAAVRSGAHADSFRMDEFEAIQKRRRLTSSERAELLRIAKRWMVDG